MMSSTVYRIEICDAEADEDDHEEEKDLPERAYDQLFFFDFECRQEDETYKPNLCVVLFFLRTTVPRTS